MGYINIQNLYANQDILLFKECYALEKIHGSSAHISFNLIEPNKINYHSGGEKNTKFVALFDQQKLLEVFPNFGVSKIVVFGEAYGGVMQHMSHTYGKELKFIVFDIRMDDNWLNVPNAESVAKTLGLEFVYYEKISTSLEEIDKQRDADSVQAVRNGMGTGHKREGVVLRPLIELTKNNGERVCAKHKIKAFCETATERKVDDPEKLKILEDAEAIANEWVTYMRL